ncbi:MAG: hypothetical protein HN919_16130 [Verrucomicrobia bacterium]|jgi:hypothetical protein|nr:hypothetical protein [Verrucomicrobiota bacterium]MBT7067828.1 hypothetical protein [Verrucomicrobiota bacterium]MBT7700286.1 hypothetical protein [Verrucomicrobiota bacterium]
MGTFQADFGQWYARAFGFRPRLIRCYNEVMYRALRESAETKRQKRFVGRDGWLYSWDYIEHLCFPRALEQGLLSHRVATLAKARDILAQEGVALVVAVAPSKANVHADMLPARFRRLAPPPSECYQSMINMFEESEIPYVDFDAQFIRHRKEDRDFMPFPSTGIHWNYVVAGDALEQIMGMAEQQLGFPIKRSVPRGVIQRESIASDRDLLDMLNIATTERFVLPSPYPRYEKCAPEGAQEVKMFFVGDSFASQLIRIIADQRMCPQPTFWSYFCDEKEVGSTYRRAFRTSRIDKPAIDWDEVIAEHDIIVIEFNVVFCWNQQEHGFGWGFADRLVAAMERSCEEEH